MDILKGITGLILIWLGFEIMPGPAWELCSANAVEWAIKFVVYAVLVFLGMAAIKSTSS